ncbi:MAG: hypothetical protein ACQXXH_05310 [Candidatus Bathyarchaeia archaeon]|nr:hypothetical protein [Candidatus Bathyarchaeota archaeon A05DMB-4]MDH7595661.1 hypothetical protein [Candidatus Bathyarchaeota archaeon]
MVKSCDVGSLPFPQGLEKYVKGAEAFEEGRVGEWAEYFEKTVTDVFLDKLRAGIDVPNFPQFRDMSLMFLGMMTGLEKTKEGYVEVERLELKRGRGCLPEVSALKKNAREIHEKYGKTFSMRVCVTGPYTLASFFPYRTSETFGNLGVVLSRIVEHNVFREKAGGVVLVSIDEPLFGVLNDPLIDRGSFGRENLFSAWRGIFGSAKACGVQTCLHLHNTSDGLFWDVEGLDVIESHVDDSIYQLKKTKELLEAEDKFLKASVCITDFDRLIKEAVGRSSAGMVSDSSLNQELAEVWKKIRKGLVAPEVFLETEEVIKQRALRVVEQFGAERVLFVGPECGLRGFPSYECGVECLRRVAGATKQLNV